MKKIISATLLVAGFLLGASALSVFATGTWSPAPSTPPDNNVDAPINVGSGEQTKKGPLILNFDNALQTGLKILGGIQIINTGYTAVGSVLTNVSGDGIGKWVMPSGGGPSVASYAYYCFSKANWGASNGGVMGPVCTNAGGTQGFCPAGYKQIQNLGVWGRCHYNGGFTLPAGGTCDIDFTAFGNGYLCAK